MKKFQPLEALPETSAELDAYTAKIRAAINVFQARADNGEEFEAADVEELESLNKEFDAADSKLAELTAEEQSRAERLEAALAAAKAATAPKPEPEPEPEKPAADEVSAEVPAEAAAEVVAEAEQVTQEAAVSEPVVAAAAEQVSFAHAAPAGDVPKPAADEPRKPFLLASTAPNFAQHDGQLVDTAVIAAGIANNNGTFTGLRTDGPTVVATMERHQGKVVETYEDFQSELERVTTEIPGHGKVSADTLVAAGGWCAPSEQWYDFCPTQPAIGLLSFPEMHFKRGGVIFPAEPDFSSLQQGFHFTEAQLEAVDGQGEPTAIKPIREVPCPPEMVEYRLEALGIGIKVGVLQKRAWPELVKKFLDEALVEHQYETSKKSLLKVLAASGSAKVVPTDAVLGATTSILNGLHVRARNIQLKTRKKTIEGIAPLWFRDVLRADLAGREGRDMLDVTDGDVDRWLAARDIYLQYEGRWQSLEEGQPGHYDTSWWPGSVEVVLYPAGTFWRVLDRVLTIGVDHDIDMVTKNRQLLMFTEDEFQVGKQCDPSHRIQIPLCVNGAVGAREQIDCSGPYAATVTKTVTTTGTPTGGHFTLKFSANDTPSGNIAHTASAATIDTTLTAIDDSVTDITTAGGPLPTAVTVTYPAELGDLEIGTNGLTGGTDPQVVVS